MKGRKILGACLIALPFIPAVYYMVKQVGITGAVTVWCGAFLAAAIVCAGIYLITKE